MAAARSSEPPAIAARSVSETPSTARVSAASGRSRKPLTGFRSFGRVRIPPDPLIGWRPSAHAGRHRWVSVRIVAPDFRGVTEPSLCPAGGMVPPSRRLSISSPPPLVDGAGFIPEADRIATFDNDGTLWVEQPMPPSWTSCFASGPRGSRPIRRWPHSSRTRPSSRRTRRSSRESRRRTPRPSLRCRGLHPLMDRDHAGGIQRPGPRVADHRQAAQTRPSVRRTGLQAHARTARSLRAHEFRVFVCSGGGRDFMRVFAERTWGVFKEKVIGSAAAYTYADGRIVRSDRMGSETWTSGRASPSTSSPRRAHCPRSPAAMRTSTSRC